MHHRKKTTFAFGLSLSPHKGKQTQTRQHVDEHEGRYIWEGKGGGGGGLNFPRFADSRKGGGNAMGKGGGSREREWGILTVT